MGVVAVREGAGEGAALNPPNAEPKTLVVVAVLEGVGWAMLSSIMSVSSGTAFNGCAVPKLKDGIAGVVGAEPNANGFDASVAGVGVPNVNVGAEDVAGWALPKVKEGVAVFADVVVEGFSPIPKLKEGTDAEVVSVLGAEKLNMDADAVEAGSAEGFSG